MALHFSTLQINFYLIVIICCSVIICCPPEEEIGPDCKCTVGYSNDNVLVCHRLLSPDQLHGPLRAISKHKAKLFSLTIDDSSLMYIPSEIFKDTSIEVLHLSNSEIMSLSDTDVAFTGLENSLKVIRAIEANFVIQWDWQQLRNLKNLNLIDVNCINLGSIAEAFPNLPELTALGITRAEISFIVDSAFTNLPKLRILDLKDNDISEFNRDMLPNPAQELMILDLSANQISHLPVDIFNNMPNLSEVHLDKNKFTTLPEKPFMLALHTIHEVTMSDNSFRCDCRMRWIVDAPVRNTFTAQCSTPEALYGKQIIELDLQSLWCY